MNDPLTQLQTAPVSLDSVLSTLRKRVWMIVAIVVSLPALVAFVVSKETKIYEATATIIIDSSVPQYLGSSFKDVVEVEANWWNAQETLQTELRVIRSMSQSIAVAKALCVKKIGSQRAIDVLVPGMRCDDPDSLTRVGSLLQVMVRAEPQPSSRIVNITVDHATAELAALIANTAGEVYTERNLARRLSQSEGAATWLGDEYGDLSSQLAESEKTLIDFKKKNNVVAVSLEDQQSDLAARRRKLADELNGVDVKLIALHAQREEYALLKTSDPMEDVTPGISDSPVMLELKKLYIEQYHKLAELKGKYLDKHPLVVAQEARVTGAKNDLMREASLGTKNVEAQYRMLLKQQHDLKTALDASTREALQLEQRGIEYRTLKRNYDHVVKLSETVGGRERETSLAGHLKTNNVRPLDAALVPAEPISPNVPRAIGAAFAVAILLAFGLAFLLELLDSTVKDQDDIERKIGLSFLGLIPSMQPSKERTEPAPFPPALADVLKRGSKDLYVLSHPKSALAECCRAIRTNLLFMTPDNPAKKLLITSASSQEGKTTTAVNLAIVMAQSGLRVLLVDTDMRRPRLHKAFGIPATSDGLSKAILGEAQVLDQVRETGVPNLSLLPCGATPPNPAELLHAERFKRIVAELEGAFDRVIFDSPPVGPVTDAAILARMTDGTIMVAKFGSTSKDGLIRARRQLVDGGVNVLGCILNDLDLANGAKYGYYAGKYGYYYAENENESDKAKQTAV
ncbi:MAG: capsular exopolysaccharide family protein [Myxococcales bacterium]|nr:capsular exopolysaccharide family protein [Myxococcales bacterium]